MATLTIPASSIVNIRVKGISTVVGGYSTTYPMGSTEAFAYYTAFKFTLADGITQLGTANGTPEYALKESGAASTCLLEIDNYEDYIRFGIKDLDTRARRVWQLTVDYDINFNRLLDDTENKEDLSGIDIPQAIEEFVNLLEIKNKKEIIDYTLGLYEKSKL